MLQQDEVRNWVEVPVHTADQRVTDVMDPTGRNALVTGAGGEGLGHAIASRLAGLGADITPVGRTQEKLELGRAALPDEVANMVAFLASDAADGQWMN